MITPAPFSRDDAQRAWDEWGANCGPGAIAAVLGKTLDEVRPHLQDFEKKKYSNIRLVEAALRSLGVKWRVRVTGREGAWPQRGLLRIQWKGPWTAPGVHWGARQRHTHWIGARKIEGDSPRVEIFDINCMCVGGWVIQTEWEKQVVPWLLKQCEPQASGKWYPTHILELEDL